MLTQGTVSILIGCHSPVHSILTIKAWKRLYGTRPALWQIVCIFLHDIGHFGLNYLDDFDAKKRHWMLGASIAYSLFGQKGFDFLAGHCIYSEYPLSDLYKADKYSYYIAPLWYLLFIICVEPKLQKKHTTRRAAAVEFKEQVRRSIESGTFTSTHSFFLNQRKEHGDLRQCH